VSKEPVHHQTLADLALQLGGVSTKTARRMMVRAMELDPDLRVIRRGRTLLFSDAAVQRILKALEWRIPSAGLDQRHTRVTSSTLARREALSGKTAQEIVREMARERLRKPATKPTKSRRP
jgi:hypothetical protein